MSLLALMYHDIETAPTARRYSFTLDQFRAHLAAVRAAVDGSPALPGPGMSGFAFTFDDGHPGWLAAGEALEKLGWKAAFFVISGAVGKAGRLDRAGVRRLAEMGHVIGSHSVDHPDQLSSYDEPFILDQWVRSKAALEDILGAPVTSASVPDGFYSERVGRAAAAAGLTDLFTSEPVTTGWSVGSCRVWGRFALVNGMGPERVARLAAGAASERAFQYVTWNIKKALKTTMMRPYRALRRALYEGTN